MLLPYTVDVPMYRLPLANWVLIGITSLVSLSILFSEWASQESVHSPKPLRYQQNKKLSKEEFDELIDEIERSSRDSLPAMALNRNDFSLVQLFTYVFVHGDLLHLAGNMMFLFVFGNAVNAKLGHGLFVACYFLLGAFSGACWLIFSNGIALVGASGAIMGLVGIFFVLFPKNDVQIFSMFSLAWTGDFRISA